ncbi:MAG: right-handed parallel beta-helix repeat-containing protein, partial [Kiritimatiellae bacterium]|nr:right-handed parallel beta-helix repeat-containing protein [Kiritimatiellia bacterium]
MKTNAGGLRLAVRLWAAMCSVVAGADYYVGPGGSDANPGTVDKPFKTIAKARDVVRTVNSNMTADIHVHLRGGWHFQSATLTFDARDSGFNGFDVVYEAYADELPVISGGRRLTGWTLHDPSNNIWKASAPGLETRQLYVNCVRATRAHSGGSLPGGVKTSAGYTTTDMTMQTWGNQGDIEFVYNSLQNAMYHEQGGPVYWREWRMPVKSVSGNVVTMQTPCWSSQSSALVTLPTDIENAYELLNKPGEWYLDRAQDMVYYKPLSGQDVNTATVIAPVLERLVSAVGSAAAPIRNLRFRGITFAHATWLGPNGDSGFRPHQANQTSDFPGGNVLFKAVRRVRFERCVFKHLGREGLELSGGAQNCAVLGCVFTDISANGLRIGTTSDRTRADTRLRDTDNEVSNCHVHHAPSEYHDGCGILAGYVANLTLSHNEIGPTPYTGISCGWGWSTNLSYARSNQFAANHIHDVMQSLADGGCIYTLSPQPQTRWHHNWFDSVPWRSCGGAIYPDQGSAQMEIDHNVVSDIGNYWLFIHTGSIMDLAIHDNWSTTATARNYGTRTPVTGLTILSGSPAAWPAEAQAVAGAAGIEPAWQDVKSMPCACSIHSGLPWPPGDLVATAVGAGRVELAWADRSTNEVGFKVDRRQDGSGWVRIAEPGANATAYTDTTAAPTTTYSYVVRAYNGSGNSADSNVAEVSTPGSPAAPTELTALAHSYTRLDLNWTDRSYNESGFDIERRPGGAGSWVHMARLPADSEGWSDGSVQPGQTFTYQVRAFNGYGDSGNACRAGAGVPTVPSGAMPVYAAYNDLAWFSGQPSRNITTYTTTNGFAAGVNDGLLTDHATGQALPVRLRVAGGSGVHAGDGRHPAAGTDAYGVFAAKVDGAGAISYGTDDLTLTFSGMDPALRYELALYADRGEPGYVGGSARWHRGILEGAAGFENASTLGAAILTTSALADTACYNAGCNYPASAGYVTRFQTIDPGPDGAVVLRVKRDPNANGYTYANALALKAFAPGGVQLDAFAAYNDLAWFAGQRASNVTTYTTGQGGGLRDHASGTTLAATLTVTGGAAPQASQGAHPAAGTDAHAFFDGKLDGAGTISYDTQDLVLSFAGLAPTLRYEVVLYADRNATNYAGSAARWQRAVLEGAESFANASSAGASVLRTATPDDTTVYNAGYNRQAGYVTRFVDIAPGADGRFTLTVRRDPDTACYTYANAVLIRTLRTLGPTDKIPSGTPWRYRPGSAEASTPADAWRLPTYDDSGWAEGPAPFGYSSDPAEGPFGTTLA